MSTPSLVVSPEVVARISELMRCDFSHEKRLEFLQCSTPRDVQAAPGAGKTTLLVAKLALLAEQWQEPRRGVCVLSHTNVARSEVQRHLARTTNGTSLLGYPHFVGTITSFIHQFVAFPYLRGTGRIVRFIDDDTFGQAAMAAASRERSAVSQWLNAKPYEAPGVVRTLTLAPHTLVLADSARMPSKASRVRPQLEQIKNKLSERGIYRYADMLAVAQTAVAQAPALAGCLATRFPFVFIDEAQDTSTAHRALLKQLFGASCLQWLGDCNQALFDDDDGGAEADRWQPDTTCIDLGDSKRFGPNVASFASRLTVVKPQVINGVPGKGRGEAIFLFDEASIGKVLPEYANFILDSYGGSPPGDLVAWAVSFKHRLKEGTKAWPSAIGHYYPPYEAPGTNVDRPATLIGLLRIAADRVRRDGAGENALADYASALSDRFDAKLLGEEKKKIRPSRLWSLVEQTEPGSSRVLRGFLATFLSRSMPTTRAEWESRVDEVRPIVVKLVNNAERSDVFLDFEEASSIAPVAASAHQVNVYRHASTPSISIRLGTIASVKGQTHHATLVCETNVSRVMDVEKALTVAFSRKARASNTGDIGKALINIFVAATRPTDILCFAVRKGAFSEEMRTEAGAAGWKIVDTTAGPL